jgi:hypothetical protein
VEAANKLFTNIKQTSDATLDSRLLVNAADLAGKRAIQNKYGNSDTGVDIDEFVSKCAAFMRRGPSDIEAQMAPQSTQLRRPIRDDSDDEQERDNGDELNWSWLGLKCAFPCNIRPPTPGWLLGPLSVEKKTRKQTQRTARQERRNPADATRPDELKADQIQKQENANLTQLVIKTFAQLRAYVDEQAETVKAILGEDPSEEEAREVCSRHHISLEGGACLYTFAFNPKSFGQTVENLFYISFLIRDGRAGIFYDHNGLPTLRADPGERDIDQDAYTHEELAALRAEQEKLTRNAKKHQSVFHIDYDMWKDLIETFEIKESVIPHRIDDGERQLGATGWYG